MIKCAGELNLSVSEDSASHVRVKITKDSPPGHLPQRIFDMAILKEDFIKELKEAKVI